MPNQPGRLTAKGIPFVDCGMGLNRVLGGLNGSARITGTDRAAFEKTAGTVHLPTTNAKEDEYRKQAQIAELNAFTAALAVMRFKQHFNLYAREDDAGSYIFETTSFELEALGRLGAAPKRSRQREQNGLNPWKSAHIRGQLPESCITKCIRTGPAVL
jgi:hypothetical protein